VQGRAWREEIPQTSFVSLAFPLSPSCEAVRTSVVDRVISGVERAGIVGFLIRGGEWERRSNPGGGEFLVLVGAGDPEAARGDAGGAGAGGAVVGGGERNVLAGAAAAVPAAHHPARGPKTAHGPERGGGRGGAAGDHPGRGRGAPRAPPVPRGRLRQHRGPRASLLRAPLLQSARAQAAAERAPARHSVVGSPERAPRLADRRSARIPRLRALPARPSRPPLCC
jgi:hypothetical protein